MTRKLKYHAVVVPLLRQTTRRREDRDKPTPQTKREGNAQNSEIRHGFAFGFDELLQDKSIQSPAVVVL